MENEKALCVILDSLKRGYRYGRDISWDYYNDCPVRFPYFETAISYDRIKGIFRYAHFGSSAISANKRELRWLLDVIFKLSPCDFLRLYIRNDASKYCA